MLTFVIYTFQFAPVLHPIEGKEFTSEERASINESLKRKQEILGSYLDEGFELEFRHGEDYYNHKWLARQDGIYVFRIANNKNTTVETDFVEQEVKNHPSCIVIIDNRNNRQVIAIQRTSKAWKKTNDVAAILQETFNTLLRPKYRIQLSIDAKYHTHEFWEVVSSFRKGIKKVTFTFPYPNLPQISDLVGDFYHQVALETDSEPSTTLTALPNQTTVKLDKKSLLLANMIDACAASGKPIRITPVGSKEIHLGEDGLVEEKMSDVVLKNFADKHDLSKAKWDIIVEFLNHVKLVYE